MAFSHGKDSEFGLGTSGTPSSATDISDYLTACGLDRGVDSAETSTLGNTSKTFLAGLLDGSFSIEGKFDPTVDEHLEGILGVNDVAFEYYPQGNSSGKVKYSGTCICTSYNTSSDIGDSVTFSADFQVDGDVTRGTV